MKLLVVGGAGHVGKIIRPVLESNEHECTHYDLRPIEGSTCRTILANVNDDAQVNEAVAGMDGVLYMPMGVDPNLTGCAAINTDPSFDVNVKGLYRFLTQAVKAGVGWFCYVSTLSVYQRIYDRDTILTEQEEPDATSPYGMSKRMGEAMCEMYSHGNPQLTMLALRLCHPMNEEGWEQALKRHADKANAGENCRPWIGTHPDSCRQLFAAALHCDKPGYHLIQATGDTQGTHFDHTNAKRILNWEPGQYVTTA